MNAVKQQRVAEANELEAKLRKLANESGDEQHLFTKIKEMLDGDMECLIHHVLIELKYGKRDAETGNTCVAVEALSHSISKWVIFYSPGTENELIVCRLPELMYWAWQQKDNFREFDGSTCLLVKRATLEKQPFTKILTLETLHEICGLSS